MKPSSGKVWHVYNVLYFEMGFAAKGFKSFKYTENTYYESTLYSFDFTDSQFCFIKIWDSFNLSWIHPPSFLLPNLVCKIIVCHDWNSSMDTNAKKGKTKRVHGQFCKFNPFIK